MGARGAALGTEDWLTRAMNSVSVLDGYPSPAGPVGETSTPELQLATGGPIPAGEPAQAVPRAPALLVTFKYPAPGGRKALVVPWRSGVQVRHYLRQQPGLISTWLRCRAINTRSRQLLRLTSTLLAGDVVVMAPGGAPLRI